MKGFEPTPGGVFRGAPKLLDANLVVPYSQQYTLQFERELGSNTRIRLSYIGSRTWKLFRTVRENRAERVEGIPSTTRTVNNRRPDPRFFTVARMTMSSLPRPSSWRPH